MTAWAQVFMFALATLAAWVFLNDIGLILVAVSCCLWVLLG